MLQNKKAKWLAVGLQQGKYETRSQVCPSLQRNSSRRSNSIDHESQLCRYEKGKYFTEMQQEESIGEEKCESEEHNLVRGKSDEMLFVKSNRLSPNNTQQQKPKQSSRDSPIKLPQYNSHLPVSIRKSQNQIHYQSYPSSENENSDQNQRQHEHEQSLVIEQHRIEHSENGEGGKESWRVEGANGSECSEIIEAVSFQGNGEMDIQHMLQQGYSGRVNEGNGNVNGNKLNLISANINSNTCKIHLDRQATMIATPSSKQLVPNGAMLQQQSRRKFLTQVRYKMEEMMELGNQLRVIQETVRAEIGLCQGNGRKPLMMMMSGEGNDFAEQLKQIVMSQVQPQVQSQVEMKVRQIQQSMQEQGTNFKASKNLSLQKQVIAASYRGLQSGKTIQAMIATLGQRQQEIEELRCELAGKEAELEEREQILLNKLAQNGFMKEELRVAGDERTLAGEELRRVEKELERVRWELASKADVERKASTSQLPTPTFSPHFEQLLKQKEHQLFNQSQHLTQLQQENSNLLNEKQSLQEELFTLQQRVIGVEMQVEQRVRRAIQDIEFKFQQRLKHELQSSPSLTSVQQHCYMETIDTLSLEITDLTDKCKSYEQYIRQQEKIQSTNAGKIMQQSKQYEDMLNKKITELEIREESLVEVERDLLAMDRKLKEVEGRLGKEAQGMDKREKEVGQKEEEVEKLVEEMKRKEEQLYVWEKQLGEEDKKLTRRLNEFQRERAMFENEKVRPVNVSTYQQGAMNAAYQPYPGMECQQVPVQPSIQQQYPQPFQQVVNTPQHNFHSGSHPYSYSHVIAAQSHTPRQQLYQQQTYERMPVYEPRVLQQNHHNLSYQHIRQQPNHQQDFYKARQLSQASQVSGEQDGKKLYELRQTDGAGRMKTEGAQLYYPDVVNPNSVNQFEGYSQSYQQTQKPLSKLYVSSTNDTKNNKSQQVQDILDTRRAVEKIKTEPRLPLAAKSTFNQFFKKSTAGRVKSPISHDTSLNFALGMSDRKARSRQKHHNTKRGYEKPSKDFSDVYKPQSHVVSGNYATKRSPYTDKDTSGYGSRVFTKSSVPGVFSINEKLQKLKQEIKREVRDLQ